MTTPIHPNKLRAVQLFGSGEFYFFHGTHLDPSYRDGHVVAVLETMDGKLVTSAMDQVVFVSHAGNRKKATRSKPAELPAPWSDSASCRAAFTKMVERRRADGRPTTQRAVDGWVRKFVSSGCSPDQAATAMMESADQGYQGVFPERFTGRPIVRTDGSRRTIDEQTWKEIARLS